MYQEKLYAEKHTLFWCYCLARFIAIAGELINWLWSFRDFGVKNLFAYGESSKPPESLLSKKVENRILWGFHSESDYNKLLEWVSKHGFLHVVLIANSVRKGNEKLSKRGVIGFGKITKDMLVGKYQWDYWPITFKTKWDWKFYIQIEHAIPKLLRDIESLRSLEKNEFSEVKSDSKLANFIKECSASILTLIPSNVTQGSKFEIGEHEYKTLRELALELWKVAKRKRLELSNLKLDNVWSVVEKYGLYYPKDVLVATIAALRSGKHLLLMGAPATGKRLYSLKCLVKIRFYWRACSR